MSTTRFSCNDTETLVAHVYGETDAATADAVTRHAAECRRCRDEITALGSVRYALAQWTPPAPPLRFSIGQTELPPAAAETPDNIIRPRVGAWQTAPAWAQVAAATLALAVGAAVANVQVRHDAQGWTVSTGWMTPAPPALAQPAVDQSWRPALAAVEQSLRSEFESRQAAAPVTSPAAGDTDTIARVRALIEASERRQQQELALRLTQFNHDLDLQRRADLIRIDQGIGQLEGRTGAEVARQRQMLDLIVRTGLRPQ